MDMKAVSPKLLCLIILSVFAVSKVSSQSASAGRGHASRPGYHERRLIQDLLDFYPYRELARPADNESTPLKVYLGLTLQQIIDVHEKNQQMVANIWMTVEWNDPTLAWNSSEYGDISVIRIPPDKIWRPDILVYNSADERFDATFHSQVTVSSDGNCSWIPPGIFRTSCTIDVTYFPFDVQYCEVKFGSWTYDGYALDLLVLEEPRSNDTSQFVQNGEWDLIAMTYKRTVFKYPCCPTPFPDITFTIIIRRRALYYTLNILVPCMVISSLALLGFTLPVESGEKLSFGITILLSLTVFMLLVAEAMPSTSVSVPLIAKYFDCVLLMVAMSVVFTVVALNVHHRHPTTHVMAKWQRSVFLEWLPWMLYMKRPGREWSPFMQNNKGSSSGTPTHFGYGPTEIQLMDRSPKRKGGSNGIVPQLDTIIRELRFLTERYKLKDMEDEEIHDWRFAAMVVDRFGMAILSVFSVVSTIAILLNHP